MPTLRGIRERFDSPIYDTHALEAGQEKRFFDNHRNLGDKSRTNMQVPGSFPHDGTYIIGAIGLRVVGKSQEEEDLLLDHLFATIVIGDKPYGPYPGNVCSTTRTLLESEKDAARRERATESRSLAKKEGTEPPAWLVPGYCLLRPLVIPVRQRYSVEVLAAKELPEAVLVRACIFGLRSRDVQ
jgi:hypothetical protein